MSTTNHPVLELRIAFTVQDFERAVKFYCDGLGIEPAAMDKLLAHGATLVHEPVMTPWGDYNVRLQDPDGMQITLFQAMDS